MDTVPKDIVKRALTDREFSALKKGVINKIERLFSREIGKYHEAKNTSETKRINAEQKVATLEKEVKNISDQSKSNLQKVTENFQELEKQIEQYRNEVARLNESRSQAEHEAAEYKKQRDAAVDENNNYQMMLERRTSEIERLQTDLKSVTTQLQTTISTKCDQQIKVEEIESMKRNLEHREKVMEKEQTILKNQVESLTNELNARVSDLMNIRQENASQMLTLQSLLDEKTEELAKANESNKSLSEKNDKLKSDLDNQIEKLKNLREDETHFIAKHKEELERQKNLANLYQSMYEDNKSQIELLTNCAADLQKEIREISDEYGKLETKYNQEKETYEDLLTKKNENIELLKKELDDANTIVKNLQDQKLENVFEKLAPSAASTAKLIKKDISFTEFYSSYLKQNEELLLKDAEIKRLNSYITNICQELDEKAPLLAQQKDEYDQAILTIQKLTKNNDELMFQCSKLREKNSDLEDTISRLEKQLDIKNTTEINLSRQICVLLQKIQDLQSGSSSTELQSDDSDFKNCSDIAAKKLVTFSDIVELQENNKKLLCIYHELTHYDKEKDSESEIVEKLQQNVDKLREEQTELLKSQENQAKMLTNLIRQRDKYKEMYQQAVATSFSNDSRSAMEESSQIFETSTEQISQLEQLKSELANNEKIMNAIKQEYENYQKEKSTNEAMTMEQLEKLQEENKSLTQKTCKLTSTIEYKDEKLKIFETNMELLKQKNVILEKKNEELNKINMKLEQIIKQLTGEILSSESKLSHAEVLLENVKQENRILKDTENRLLQEREALHRESHGQSLLLNNLESIKAAFQRTEAEGKLRLEARLDEANRELSSSRRRLQEEQDRFRELSSHLEKQLAVANSRVNEEKLQNEKLRQQLQEARKNITEKAKQIEEILKKHKENMDRDGAPLNEQVKTLKKQLENSETKAKQLEKELQTLKAQSEQFCNISQTTEKELRELTETHKQYKQATEIKMQSLINNETNLKQRIAELQKQLSQKSMGQDNSSNDLANQIVKAKDELLSTKQEVESLKAELQAAKSEILELNTNLQATENKYSREMILHSSDIQTLSSIKEEMQKLRKEREQIINAKQDALKSLAISKEGWENRERLLNAEKREIQERMQELDKQNAILHDQLRTLSAQMSQQNQMKSSDKLNISISSSFTEEEATSAEQLLQIIKFLRQDLELQNKKYDLIIAENSRIRLEYESVSKQLEEAKLVETEARIKTNSEIVTAAKYNEVLRKVETLHAITDSNRILREERDKLAKKVEETTEKIAELERELAPLKESNRELSVKAEVAQKENVSLKAEATRWRQRANSLIERANKTTPEDWRRLQTERENLAKLLMSEKENVKKANEQKTKVEQQVTILQRQIQLQNEQAKKNFEDLNTLTQQNTKITQELGELRGTNTRLTEENAKLFAEIENKNKEMKTLMTKYVSVRALARKYKVQVEEEKAPETSASGSQQDTTVISSEIQEQYREEGRREANERLASLEKTHNDKLQELNTQIVSVQEENTKLSQMHDKLRQEANARYERSEAILKSAKTRILKLNETISSLSRDLSDARSRLECQDVDARFVMLKSQYEAKIARLEKEKNECLTERQSEKDRTSREIETLNNHLSQLQRQISHGSGSKPSTSSGSNEKEAVSLPPTANIKPMAGTSQQQQSASINPRRKEDTPFASIRPMAMPSRTATGVATLFPTAVASSCPTSSPSAAVPPQQVHTTGNSSIDTLSSSSPTSSHTDYMPATSSANITPIRQATVPPTQQSIITIGVGEETPSAAESTQDMEAETVDSIQQGPQASQQLMPQAAVALVLPRVEQPSENDNQQIAEQSTSSSSSSSNIVVSSQQASSSSTVTTTQAGFKRTREATEGDSSTGNAQIDQARIEPQAKRSRVQVVTESGTTEIEYQVPTSSQRDQEDDIVCIESDEDDDDEADGRGVEEPDDGPYTGDNEGFEAEGLTYDQELTSYENAEAMETVQQDGDNNEVDFIEQIINAENELAMRNSPDYAATFPSGAGSSTEAGSSSATQAESADAGESAQSEAISSASGESNVAASLAQPGFGLRSRNITPLVRQSQQMVITGHNASGFEEQSGDDGIVPSTPTLYVPRRMDGFGEAVSSPHVPNSGRFTFNDPPATTTVERNLSGGTEPGQIEIVDESRMDQLEESGTGRSVPTTPLQVSPQGDTPQTIESNIASGSGIRSTTNQAGDSQSLNVEKGDTSSSIPDIIVSEVCSLSNLPEVVPNTRPTSAEAEANEMAPPPIESVAGTSSDSDAHQTVGDTDVEEGSDGVSSEGEKAVSVETPKVEEGREAEASPSPSSNSGMTRGGRISVRSYYRGARSRDNVHRPIVWNDPQNRAATRSAANSPQQQQSPYQPRGMRGRRGSRRPQSNNYMRY